MAIHPHNVHMPFGQETTDYLKDVVDRQLPPLDVHMYPPACAHLPRVG